MTDFEPRTSGVGSDHYKTESLPKWFKNYTTTFLNWKFLIILQGLVKAMNMGSIPMAYWSLSWTDASSIGSARPTGFNKAVKCLTIPIAQIEDSFM